MSFATFHADRNAAGERYAAAVAELEAAYKELAAFDLVVCDRRFSTIEFSTSFGFFPNKMNAMPNELVHRNFVDRTIGWDNAIDARAATISLTY